MRRMWAASAAIVVCLALGVPALAQRHSSPASTLDATSTFVTGTEHCTIDTGNLTIDADGTEHFRAGRASCRHETSDPLTSGRADYSWEADFRAGGAVQWGAGSLSNDQGAWEGTYTGIVSDQAGGDVITFWLKGTGDYAGLSYYYHLTGTGPWEVQGLIFPTRLVLPRGVR